MTRKTTILSIISIIIVLAGVALWATCRDVELQRDFAVDNSTEGVSPLMFPLKGSGGVIEFAPDLRFRLSTASTVSSINAATLERLRADGYRVDSTSSFFFARNVRGDLFFVDKVYTVDFPLHHYTFTVDSLLKRHSSVADPHPAKVVRNARFIKAPDGTDNIIGSDIMGLYVMEFSYSRRAVGFHKCVPDNYDYIGSIHTGRSIKEWLGTGHRWFVDLSIDHTPYTFLINTSLRGINLKMPLSESPENKDGGHLVNMVYPSRDFSNYYEGFIDPDAWITYGNRTGTRQIYYFDSQGEKYQVNPMIFFKNDIVIDFLNGNYYLHPQYISQRRH